MATIRILLGIVWLAVTGSSWRADRHTIAHGYTHQNQNYAWVRYPDGEREKIVAIAQKEVGVQEAMENSGPRVDHYNAYVGLQKVEWCASFISWCFGQAGYPRPRTAWSPALFPPERLAKDPLAGMVLGIYFPELKRIAHCGMVTQVKNELIFSIEGNTNVNGSREGTGVYRRVRHARSVYRFADWTARNTPKS
jgi:hypothetical protein